MLKQYAYLMRLDKPIGIFLLLWPTVWSLWLAGKGHPNAIISTIFIAGVVMMRSAGCVINDIADRELDKKVQRTRHRPLASGSVSLKEAMILFGVLLCLAFLLVLFLNKLTILLALVGAVLSVGYPFMKRVTYFPQIGLGFAFAWSVPMSFAALTNTLPLSCWLLFLAAVIWPVVYDTMYAMVDRADDIKAGIKSTAILFGRYDRYIIGLLQLLFIFLLYLCGLTFKLGLSYQLSLVVVAILFFYQQWLIKNGDPQQCFKAFLNNNWVGLLILAGIVL